MLVTRETEALETLARAMAADAMVVVTLRRNSRDELVWEVGRVSVPNLSHVTQELATRLVTWLTTLGNAAKGAQ